MTAGAAGFLTFTQQSARPERYSEPSRFDTMPSLSECSSLTKNLIELKQTTPAVAEALLWLRLSRYFSKEVVLRPAETVGLVSPNYCNDKEQHLFVWK